MKIAFIGDCHFGNHRQYGGELQQGMNERFRMTLRALSMALAWAAEQGCTDVVIAGDVFDTPKPLPQQLTAVREVLLEFSGAVHLILGNHDRVSELRGDHGLGPLSLEDIGDGIVVYDRPAVIGDSTCRLLLCPFDARPVKEWLPKVLEQACWGSGPRLVCGHFGLWERAQASSQPWLTNAADAIEVQEVAALLARHGVEELYVGNYHTHFRWTFDGVRLHQLGALVPTGFDNQGFNYGRVETWPDDQRLLVGGPRFVVVASGAELGAAAARAEAEGCVLYADWRVAPEAYEATLEAAAGTMTGESPIEGGPLLPLGSVVEVHVDRKFSKLRAAEAAGAARASETLIEAVHAFVQKAEMPPHVSRANVLEHVRRFLRC